MTNTSSIRLASVITLVALVLVSLFGIYTIMSVSVPKVTLGFLVIILTTLVVLACVIIREDRAAFVVGVGGIVATAALLLMRLLCPGRSYVPGLTAAPLSWYDRHADLLAVGIGLACVLVGSVVCFIFM